MMADKPPSNSTETSQAAADSVKEDASTLRSKVLEVIRKTPGGLTTDEVEQLLHLNHQTASPRMWELHRRGLIGDSGNRRKTRSGRMAIVYRALTEQELADITLRAVKAARQQARSLEAAAAEMDEGPPDPLIRFLQSRKRGRPQ